MSKDAFKGLDMRDLIPADVMAAFRPVEIPEIRNPMVESLHANYASAFHERLVQMIKRFDAALDQEHEVGARLVSFGEAVIFHLTGLGYWNPSLILFKGETDDGTPVELIQHVSQISVLLTRLPRKDPSKPKRPIGFTSE